MADLCDRGWACFAAGNVGGGVAVGQFSCCRHRRDGRIADCEVGKMQLRHDQEISRSTISAASRFWQADRPKMSNRLLK